MQYCTDTQSLPGLPPGGPASDAAQPLAVPHGARRGALPVMSQAEKAARADAKRRALLAFLAGGEVWTVCEIAAQIIGASPRRAAATLAAMERDALIASEVLDWGGRKMKIFGVTHHGLAVAGQFDSPAFERSRTNPAYVAHKLAGQRARLAAEAFGWRDWQPERVMRIRGVREGWAKIPDAVATAPNGVVCALEIERHVKSKKRMAELLPEYILEINRGRYKVVIFLCPPGVEGLVKEAMGRVLSMKLNGEMVAVTDEHRARFRYIGFDQWPGVKRG